MDDTTPDIAEKMREMIQMKAPQERLKMGFSMYETSKYLVARSIHENKFIYSGAELRQELFLKFYGSDFDPITQQKILEHLGPTHTGWNAERDPYHFDHIPKIEKEQEWWIRLLPLIQARLLRGNQENSKLLRALNKANGFRTWRNVKNLIEVALKSVENGQSILSRTSEIKSSPDPDGIIDDMFGELRTIPYLFIKGFKNISYSRRENLDFKAEFGGRFFNIESTYVHGPDFKTQEYTFTTKLDKISPIYKICPDKLIQLFERTYSNKRNQILRHQGTVSDSLIFMITDLEETYEPWLDHAKIQGVHPILKLIRSWEIPAVIFGCGSVYEPLPDSLSGIFGSLHSFDWSAFEDFCSNLLSNN